MDELNEQTNLTEKSDNKTELTPEYGGLSEELTAKTGEPTPLAGDKNPPLFKPVNLPEEVKIPEEANNYDTAEKLRWLFLILFLAAPFVAAVVLLLLGYRLAGMICVGVFVAILPAFFIISLTRERNAIIGKGIKDKPDARRIEAQVVSCVCVTRTYKDYRDSYRRLVKREVVDATYKTVISDGRNNYVAKTKIFYYPREEVEAYVRGKRAYIDPTIPKNKREVNND